MKLQLDYEVTDKPINWKLSIFGVSFLCFRIICMSVFIEPDGRFHPEIFHTSYIISILLCLSMVFSFRVKPLNMVAFAVFPSVIFSILLHDIPLWLDPSTGDFGVHAVGDLLWWNFLTIHTPIPILALYMFLTRKDTLTWQSYFLGLPFLLTWFIMLDDKQNGTIDGDLYIAIALPIFIVWTLIIIWMTFKDWRAKNPLIAPVLRVKSLKLIKSQKK